MFNSLNSLQQVLEHSFAYCLRSKSRMDLITTALGFITVIAEAIHEGIDIIHEPFKLLSLLALALWSVFTNRIGAEVRRLQGEICRAQGCNHSH